MNNDLISRSALLEEAYMTGMWNRVTRSFDLCVIDVDDVVAAPAVDAAPVRHGRYGFVGPHIGLTCSPYAEHGTCNVCKERILIDPQHKNYCPNCGAKMDAEVQDD